MNKSNSVAVAIFIASSYASDALAYGYCSKPSEPHCLDMLSLNRDEFSFSMCRSEVERYLQDVNDYVACVYDEAAQEESEQTRKANDAISRFNCYAQGSDFCP